MAKIGILTFHNTLDNYGQVLQYLATQEFLQTLGHHAVLIETCGYKMTVPRRLVRKYRLIKEKILSKLTRKEPLTIVNPITEIEEKKYRLFKTWAETTLRKETVHPRHFKEFRTTCFNQQSGTYDDILSSGYDAFCIGSDQTWSGAGFHMMLGWVPQKYKKFSIAPSVGHRLYTDEEVNSFKKYLRDFDFITVREKNGIDLCERCGIKTAVKVLDPTFLLSSNQYNKFAWPINSEKKYIFAYFLGGEISENIVDVFNFYKSKGYDIKYVESQGREENIESIPATVSEWLGFIKNAEYVVTNSFHGVAFSIIYHKPFLVFPLVGLMEGMNGRIIDVANRFHLEKRIYDNDLSALFAEIEWAPIEHIISENKDILKKMLREIEL